MPLANAQPMRAAAAETTNGAAAVTTTITTNNNNQEKLTCFLCCKPQFVPKRPRKVVQDVLASLEKDEWLGPIFLPHDINSKRVHQSCGLWCPEVYYDHEKERLRKLPDAIQRSKKIPCHKCKQKGAAIGCVVPECPRSYHLICAHDDKCAFNTSTYSLACPMHIKRLTSKNAIEWTNFALEELLHPKDDEGDEDALEGDADEDGEKNARFRVSRTIADDGMSYLPLAAARAGAEIKPRGNKAARFDHTFARSREALIRKSVQEAERRERKRKENEIDEIILHANNDELAFQKREKNRKEKDTTRIERFTVGGGSANTETNTFGHPDGWDSIAGNPEIIHALKEVTVLPLLYPDIFKGVGVNKGRGILLHGAPGTGKTAAVRALVGAIEKQNMKNVNEGGGDGQQQKITFFCRKGADCLGKYSGEAERTLRLIFEEAQKCAPSVIFFDEMDGLAPNRANQASDSSNIHASVVTTLLSLMDGVSDRGQVIVIGATNRPDAIDPALRRPGRFDREILFSLPNEDARFEILKCHTSKWTPTPPTDATLRWVAKETNNCSGADLRATCNAALISSLMRFLQNQLLNPPLTNTYNNANKANKRKNKLLNDCFQSRDELMATFDHALPENATTKKLKSFIVKQHETDVVRHVGRELTLRGWDALGTRVEVYWSRANTFRRCTISSFDPTTLRHKCEYDDVEGAMFRNGEKIIREEWLPLFRPGTLVKILKAEDEDHEILDEAKRNTIIEIAVRANALKKRHKDSLESFALAQSKGEVKGVERADWRVGLEKHSGNKASSRRSSAFARSPVGAALPNYLVGTTKLHECITSASKPTKKGGGSLSKILFANCPAQTSLLGLASLQLSLDPVKIVCQIDLASILERGDGDALVGTQKILSENLVRLKRESGDEDNTILLLLPKLETWALAAEMHEKSDDGTDGGADGVLTTSKAWDCVAQTVDDCRGRGIENVFVAATCAFDSKHLPKSMRAFFTTKTYSNVGDVLDVDALKMRLAEDIVSVSFVPAFFRELLQLEENEEQDEYESAEEEDDEEEQERKEEEKERSDFILLKRLQKENDDISSELRLLTAHLVRLDRLKPFFESEAGKFWRDVDANTCLSSLDEFVESLQLATAKITRGRNPKFILGNGKKMALRSAASYCLDLTEEFIVARGLRQMQKKSDETKKQLTLLEQVEVEPLNGEKEDEQAQATTTTTTTTTTKTETRKRKCKTPHSIAHATIKIKRSVLRPMVKLVAEKMSFATSSPPTVEDVLRERDSLSTSLTRRAKHAARNAFSETKKNSNTAAPAAAVTSTKEQEQEDEDEKKAKKTRLFFFADKTNAPRETKASEQHEEERVKSKKINDESVRVDGPAAHLFRSLLDVL